MEQSGELEKFTSSIGADGKERPRQVERKTDRPISVMADNQDTASKKAAKIVPIIASDPVLTEARSRYLRQPYR